MPGLTNAASDSLYDHITRRATWPEYTGIYIALYTLGPNDAGGGTEATGGNYARVEFSTATNWGGSTNGSGSNSMICDFGVSGANWGTITQAGLHSALTGDVLIAYGDLTTARPVDASDTFQFPVGNMVLNMNSNS